MTCEKCGAEVKGGGKFCQNCGAKLFEEKTKKPQEINLDWLNGIMTRVGYKREPDKEGNNQVFGTHPKMHNLALTLKKELGLIMLESYFLVKKAGWKGRTDLYLALNKANGAGNITTWFFRDTNDLLGAFSFVPITEFLSEGDVITMIEKFNGEITNGLSNSGLINFLPS
jgi:hypothetical protein